MAQMKRFSAFFIALALCFGLLTAGAAAYYTDETEITRKEAVQSLSALNILNGYEGEDGSFAFLPRRSVTRGEFCKMLCVVMNGGAEPTLGDIAAYSFGDTRGHWAAKYIEFLAGLNIVSGYGDGTFGPDADITAQQAAKLLLAAVGYDAAYERLVGSQWASRADALANGNDLYGGLGDGFVTTAALNREDAAQIIYNALFCHMRAYVSAGEHGVVGVKCVELELDGRAVTVFEYYYNAHIAEGVVSLNADGCAIQQGMRRIALMPHLHTENGKTCVIDWRTSAYNWFDGPEGGVAMTDVVNSETGLDMLGLSVRYAYTSVSVAGVERQTVIGRPVATEYNKILELDKPGVYTEGELGLELLARDPARWWGFATALVRNGSVVGSLEPGKSYFLGNGWRASVVDNNGDGAAELIKELATTPYKVESVKDGLATLRNLATGEMLRAGGIWNYMDAPELECYTGGQAQADTALIPLERIAGKGGAKSVGEGDILLAAIYGGRVNCADYSTFTGEIDRLSHRVLEEDGEKWTEHFVTIDGELYAFHDSDPGGAPYTAQEVHNGSLLAGRDNKLLEVGARLKLYADEDGYIFYAEELESAYASPKFALAVECDPIQQYSEGQPIRLVLSDGSIRDVMAGRLWLYDAAEGKYAANRVSYAKDIWLNLTQYETNTCIVAYVEEEDGTVSILPIGDGIDGQPGFSPLLRAWAGVVTGDTRIAESWDAEKKAPNVGAYVENIYSDSKTNFIDVRSNPTAYQGYAAVPSLDWTLADIYAVTDEMAAAAFEAFNGVARETAGNPRLLRDVFMVGASFLVGGLVSTDYFYIPNTSDVTRMYYNGVLVDEYSAVLDGEPGKKIMIPVRVEEGGNITSGAIDEDTLYYINAISSRGVVSAVEARAVLRYSELTLEADKATYTTLAYGATSLSLNGARILDVSATAPTYGTEIRDKLLFPTSADRLYVVVSKSDPASAAQVYVVHKP